VLIARYDDVLIVMRDAVCFSLGVENRAALLRV
jgi:hypothetical protein